MKFLVLGLLMFSSLASAADKGFYDCDGYRGVDEYRSAVDVKKKLADFFDNDTTYIMKLKNVMVLESLPPQTQYTFQGNGYKLIFNETRREATLIDLEANVEVDTISCTPGKRRSIE